MIYILIDTSYWIFYRYYAIIQWWKHAKPEEKLETDTDLSINEEFKDKFKKTFIESIKLLKKKQKFAKNEEFKIIAACDCSRKDIWRNALYENYKETRGNFVGSEFFNIVYENDNELLKKAGVNHILKHAKMEGDDIIAVTKKMIREKYENANIYIIANDYDYLQLLDDNTKIINFKNKNLLDNKKIFKESDKNLFYKIVLGDKSDNIKPIFKKCGKKKVGKYYEDRELFEKALKKENVMELFELNKKLISFTEIPVDIEKDFIELNKEVLLDL